MKVLVTGGGGFLGGYIIDELLALKYEVSNLSRHAYPELINKNVECIQGDISNLQFIEKLDLSKFDTIFHVAAKAGVWGSKESYYSINYHGSKQLFEKAKNKTLTDKFATTEISQAKVLSELLNEKNN